MKKLIAVFLCLALLLAFAYAQQGAESPGEGAVDAAGQMVGDDRDEHGCIGSAGYQWCEEKQKCLRIWEEECPSLEEELTDEEESGETQTQAGVQEGETIRNQVQLRENLQQKQQEMAEEISGMGEKEQKVYQNQNQVRLAVHALISMENMVGGIGPQVSEIARNFDNSVQATIRAEERIEKRSALARFFAGGDNEAAEEIEVEVNQNRVRIEQLKQLRAECDCDGDTEAAMLEQIQAMEQEQTRLMELAENQKSRKGLLGWLWK